MTEYDPPQSDDPSATGAPPAGLVGNSTAAAAAIEDDDPRMVAALAEYMDAMDAGRRPNRQEFLARHADIASSLSVALQGLAFVHSAAVRINGHSHSADSGGGGRAARSPLDGETFEGKPLGDFKLLREIGRGGMGVVYEAEQLSLGRRVAVKVLSFAAALDSRHLQRFRNEAQAAAQLHHSNIVPVYAVGSERSVHFYAMQLIEGQSLADVIRAMRKQRASDPGDRRERATAADGPEHVEIAAADTSWHPSTPQQQARLSYAPSSAGGRLAAVRHLPSRPAPAENLSTLLTTRRSTYYQTVARLGLQAAQALAYAHDKGVVHRDVKPANLLLDCDGNLWITDFGLAQFYDTDVSLTQTGDLLGTVRYMSPEQASGKAVVLDQRTDIYSLGITLYELLTLKRALPGATREQLLYEISSVEPRAPRSIDKAIPRELEIVIGKAISKDPTDRYPSAQAMADDLGRFLRDEPIHARPPSLFDKSVKWTRRHRSLAISAMAMLSLVALAAMTSTVLIAREQANTKRAFDLEKQHRAEAERSFREARESVEFFTHIAADEMADKPGFGDVRKQMLEGSLAYYQAFLDQRKNDPSTGLELEQARTKVASILSELAAGDTAFHTMMRQSLLGQESVQRELGISPDVADSVQRFTDSVSVFKELQNSNLTSEQKRERTMAMATAVEDKLNSSLTPWQASRLRQIWLQDTGPFAFGDPALSETLSLTHEQRDAIQTIMLDCKDRIFRHGHRPEDQPGRSREDTDRRIKRDAMTRILARLTPAQVEVWNALLGPPFAGPIYHGRNRRH